MPGAMLQREREREGEREREREMKKGEFSTFITVIRAGHMLSLHSANEA